MPTNTSLRDPDDLPALYKSTNRQSLDAQQSYFVWFRLRLGGLIFAAIGGAVGLKLSDLNVGGAIAVVAFAAALAAELVLAIRRPDRIWYEARAAAESAKTLSWRYMVRGESFETNVADADATFLAELHNVLQDLESLPAPTESGVDLQISAKMREVRALPFGSRRSIYLLHRIQDQQGWYAAKAKWNAARANRLVLLSIAFEFLGLIGGVAKAVGWIDVDVLGIFAAAAAGATAWLQAKQHQNLATAYGITSQELASVASEVEALHDEKVWSQFVAEAEEAISREHTLWRASRGIHIRRRNS